MKTLEWRDGALHLIDQRRLPHEVVVERCAHLDEVARAISELRVRGAPAIGIAAAYGLAIAARASDATTADGIRADLARAATRLKSTRPTAVNLAWCCDKVQAAVASMSTVADVQQAALDCADALAEEDLASCHRIGDLGAPLMPTGATVLTHCNAGGLATMGHGTALGVIRTAYAQGRIAGVIACETRPVLQGARLTAWELERDCIPVTLIADTAAAHLMARGKVQAVVVGADRIAANGDVANKIGTYGLAVLAAAHDIPFFVAAPTSTVDLEVARGSDIPIEERSPDEVTHIAGHRIAPEGVAVANPAFDVTPARYIRAIVTERGVAQAPFDAALRALAGQPLLAGARR